MAHDTYHSSSTTRTSTKKVFLLTRFLKVSGLWQKLVYVLGGQGQTPNKSDAATQLKGSQYGCHGYHEKKNTFDQPSVIPSTWLEQEKNTRIPWGSCLRMLSLSWIKHQSHLWHHQGLISISGNQICRQDVVKFVWKDKQIHHSFHLPVVSYSLAHHYWHPLRLKYIMWNTFWINVGKKNVSLSSENWCLIRGNDKQQFNTINNSIYFCRYCQDYSKGEGRQ